MSYEAPSLIRPLLTQPHSANYASHQKKLHFIDLMLSFENVCVGIWYFSDMNLVQKKCLLKPTCVPLIIELDSFVYGLSVSQILIFI